MRIFGIDLTAFFEGLEDVYNLLSAFKVMQDKKIERLSKKVEILESEQEEKDDGNSGAE